MTTTYVKETDFFAEDDRDYINTNITSHIEMPTKVLNLGELGKRIKGFEKKLDEFGDEIEDFDMPMPEDDADNIDIAMPGGDSSDEENLFNNQDSDDEENNGKMEEEKIEPEPMFESEKPPAPEPKA